jgi:hypothetical protein
MAAELPRLSSAELVQLFGDDVAALQRYRMLVALMREGRPAGEVARAFGVSRESLRRLRHAYDRGSLAALHSRKRGGGHLARGSPLVQAIREGLNAQPGVSASGLWQQVEARLREQGLRAPRSTFYRLLGRLRDEDAPETARLSARLMREALANLLEDPPIALGRSQLAELLLGDERDTLQRGRRLAAALNVAIDRLRPALAGPVLDDQRWRHYLIIAGEYTAGTERAELQETLALSPSTYTRAKREALERLRSLLPAALDELPLPGPPPSLVAPPPTEALTEREAELDQYMTVLRQTGLALIWAPEGDEPGELAAVLARRLQSRGQHVVWHVCRRGSEGQEAALQLIQALGAALALAGRRELWDLRADESGASDAQRMALLTQALAGRHWIVIVAECHALEGPVARQLLHTLDQARQRGDIRLVLAGRALPPWADVARWPALPPYGDTAARRQFLSQVERRARPPAELLEVLPAVRDAAQHLLDLLPAQAQLTPQQAAQALAALGPLARLLERLQEQADDG